MARSAYGRARYLAMNMQTGACYHGGARQPEPQRPVGEPAGFPDGVAMGDINDGAHVFRGPIRDASQDLASADC